MLVKLEASIFLEQLGSSEAPPNHPSSILGVKSDGPDGSNIIKHGLAKDEDPFPSR
jgi:hypothetical protein